MTLRPAFGMGVTEGFRSFAVGLRRNTHRAEPRDGRFAKRGISDVPLRPHYPWVMCGRYTNTVGPEEIGNQIGQPLGVQIRETTGTGRYRINPTEDVLAIVAPTGKPEPRMLRWALVPAAAETIKTPYPYINARIETLRAKGSYVGVAPHAARRALIVTDGFYEWPKPEDEKAKGKLKPPPLHFQVDGGRVFCFAGLWVTAPNVEGAPVASCTIITCDASSNRLVSPVHDRMPVILPDLELMRAWLDPSISPQEALSLCEPLEAGRMSAGLASQAVNNVRSPEGPELLAIPSGGKTEQQLPLTSRTAATHRASGR
jgi:putative SOS response-associated peptidase YedK